MSKVEKEEKQIAVTTPNDMLAVEEKSSQSPMAMMIQAKQAGFSTEEIKDMMDLQDRNDARLAKRAFDKAMAEFKRNPPKVYKDKINKHFDSSYVSIGNMVTTVNEAMGLYGLNARWEFPESSDVALITCTCILAHEQGHEVRVTLSGPVDSSGSKNALQGRKSARTYLKLETFEAVTGMASEDGNVDDDGNAATINTISIDMENELYSLCEENGLLEKTQAWLKGKGIASFSQIKAENYDSIVRQVKEKINAKKN